MTKNEVLPSFLQAGAEDLEAYLLSDTLYWQLPGPANRQRLTPGGLLLGMRQIQALENSMLVGKVNSILARIDRIKDEHRSSWETKIGTEIKARLRLWNSFLEEYRQNSEEQAAYYPREVKWRVLIQLLLEELPGLKSEAGMLPMLDKMVKSNWLPGEFIWEPYLVDTFPPSEYWFLYGKLRA